MRRNVASAHAKVCVSIRTFTKIVCRVQDKSAYYRTFGEAIQIFSCFVYERYMVFIISWRKRFQLITTRGLAHTWKQMLQLDTRHLSYSMLLAKNTNWRFLNGWTDKRKLFCINLRNWAYQFGQIYKKRIDLVCIIFEMHSLKFDVTSFPRNKISMRIDNVQTKRIFSVLVFKFIFSNCMHTWFLNWNDTN